MDFTRPASKYKCFNLCRPNDCWFFWLIFFSTEYIYTGTADGRILSIYKGQISTLAQLGKGDDCGKKCSCMNEWLTKLLNICSNNCYSGCIFWKWDTVGFHLFLFGILFFSFFSTPDCLSLQFFLLLFSFSSAVFRGCCNDRMLTSSY